MAIDLAALDRAAEVHFDTLRARVARRLAHPEATAWLFAGRAIPFAPDYLEFGAIGRHPAERLLNRAVSRLLPGFWHDTLWAKIHKRVIGFGASSYFPKLLADFPDRAEVEAITRHVLARMTALLERKWRDLRRCTFYEAFNCLAAIMNEPRILSGRSLDAFIEHKSRQNFGALALVEPVRALAAASADSLAMLIRLACRANWMDSMEESVEAAEREIEAEVSAGANGGAWWQGGGEGEFLRVAACRAALGGAPRTILYEFDNCGEVAIDLLLIEALIARGHRVILSVRELPVANDVTNADLRFFLDSPHFVSLREAEARGELDIVSSGPFAAGRLLTEAAPEYRQAWKEADLVILKGQGNFQTTPMGSSRSGRFVPFPYDKPVIMMMGVKAELARLALHSVFRNPPALGSPFVYLFDAADRATWPA
jgi:uncharacterized protein with ATP-grasp and redox domains